MNDSFLNRDPYADNLSVGSAKKLIREAKMNKQWIVIDKTWFTPEEFARHYPINLVANHPDKVAYYTKDVRLQDPVSAIIKAKVHINKKIELLTEFSVRVAKYYQGK